MYQCCDCGEIFNEEEVATVREDRGEFWGFPCSEEIPVCPACKSDDFEDYIGIDLIDNEREENDET